MPRRAQPKSKEADEIEDFDAPDLGGLMQSGSSDQNNDEMAMLAARMQASWSKKKKDKESKILQAGQSELDGHLKRSIEDFADASSEIDDMFAKFQVDYAAADEEIKETWTQILKEHCKFLNTAEQLYALELECDKGRSSQQFNGLIAMKKGCNETAKLVQQMKKMEEDSDEGDD